jgi:hypothetical protein
VLFNHMAEKRKTKRALNKIKNRGLEKKQWLILEFIVEDTKFHHSIQVFIKEFEFGHGFTQINTDFKVPSVIKYDYTAKSSETGFRSKCLGPACRQAGVRREISEE